ncbi:MAG: aldo/keto reductase [Clostridiales bacterium]|jgi:predicted aldo/keto reductase-like oxidoreductase|nr:aldo/keto reductase [Clostridiales bacterium]
MQYRQDKRNGKQLSILGFGCMRFPANKAKTEQLLLKAVERGINYFDTAYLYPGSEEILGEVFEGHGLREKVNIATKLPQVAVDTPEDFDRFFEIQKRRLRTGYIDYYLLHNISDFGQWEKLCKLGIEKWIAAKKSSGEIKQIGFSYHGSFDDFEKLVDSYDWDFVQIQYNYINSNYQAGVDGLRKAAGKSLPVFIMEPLLGGKLANLPKDAIEVLHKAKPGSTAVSWAFNWLWNDPDITLLLSGMNENSQLDENLALAEAALPNSFSNAQLQTIQDIKDIFNRSFKVPCTGCNYCMPCPKKINIPACFAAYNESYALSFGAGIYAYMMSAGAMGEFPHYASDCVNCGKCAKQCPQRIEIPKQLKNVRRRLQLPGIKKIMPFASKLMARGK